MPFFPLTKVDVPQRMVFARLDETPDADGHIMDYEASKPNFIAWSQSQSEASGGLNLGNVRGMHGGQVRAAGMVKQIDFDDAARSMLFGIRVEDDAEWANVRSGLYTGISPGGKMRKWAAGGRVRFEAKPDEMSLVDRPSNPNATFIMIKAAGLEEVTHFAPADDLDAIVERMAKAAGTTELVGTVMALPVTTLVRMFGNDGERAPDEPMLKRYVSAADRRRHAQDGIALPDGSFPIAEKGDLEAAIPLIGTARDEAAAKAHIIARAAALGADELLPADWRGDEAAMRKGLDQVSCFARILDDVTWLATQVTAEAAVEGDGSPLPMQIAGWLKSGMAILTAMAGEESAELVRGVAAQLAELPTLAAGREAVEAVLDGTDVAMAADGDGMAKAASLSRIVAMAAELAGTREEMRKFAGERTALQSERDVLTAERDALRARVTQLEARPAPGGPRLRAVGKAEDGNAAPDPQAAERARIEAMPPGRDRAIAEMHIALGHPVSHSN